MGHIFDACDEEGADKINFRHFAHCLSTVFRGTWEEMMEFWCAKRGSVGSLEALFQRSAFTAAAPTPITFTTHPFNSTARSVLRVTTSRACRDVRVSESVCCCVICVSLCECDHTSRATAVAVPVRSARRKNRCTAWTGGRVREFSCREIRNQHIGSESTCPACLHLHGIWIFPSIDSRC